MESLYNFFSKDIEVIYNENHEPTFNGWSDIHMALKEANYVYRSLAFADQMSISSIVLNNLCPLDEEVPQPTVSKTSSKHYIYTTEFYSVQNDYNCIVFDVSTGNIIFQEWFETMRKQHVMSHIDDVEGLMLYLVHHGELLEGDIIQYQNRLDEDDDTLET